MQMQMSPAIPVADSRLRGHQAGMGAADLAMVPSMGSSDLRRLSEAAAAQGASDALWSAMAARSQEQAQKLRYWDMVHILQSFTTARVENPDLFLNLADALSAKASKMAPKHILDLFAVYEAAGLRPRALYVELLHAIVRLSRSMYAEELTLTLQMLARFQLGNPTVLAQLMRTVRNQLKEFRLRYLCAVTGSLGALRCCPQVLLDDFDVRAKQEVDTVPVQELLENLQGFPLLEFSWQPYEDLCLKEFLERTKAFRTAEDIDELADPFETLNFLQAHGLLQTSYLEALCQWSLRGVHRPNVRSERRPTTRQLVNLHDRCHEFGLESNLVLQDAIRYFVESGAGKWSVDMPRPLKYMPGRRYIRTPDPLEGIEYPKVPSPNLVLEEPSGPRGSTSSGARRSSRQVEDLYGLPSTFEEEAIEIPAAGEPRVQDFYLEHSAMGVVRRIKPSWHGEGLERSETTIVSWVSSRKGPRRHEGWRHRRDPGLKKFLRKDMPRAPMWMMGGYSMRPKYHPGRTSPRYPWAGVPVGKGGAAYVLRR